MDTPSQLSTEDSEMLETFRHLSPLLEMERFERSDAARDVKKAKKDKEKDKVKQ
jgi:hypothetical protein